MKGSIRTGRSGPELLLQRVNQLLGDAVAFRSLRDDFLEVPLGPRGVEHGTVHRFDGELGLAGDVGIGPATDLHGIEEIPRIALAEHRGVRAQVEPRGLVNQPRASGTTRLDGASSTVTSACG